MKTIGAFNAKTHLSDLLEKVSRGESFVITKRGKPMAALSPVVTSAKALGPKDIVMEFRKKYAKALRKNKISIAEIIEMKNEGRR
jgi:prevent-host-death family protein